MKSRETTTEKRHAIFARNERTLGASLRERFSDIEAEMDEFREFIADARGISPARQTLAWRFRQRESRSGTRSNLLSLASRRGPEAGIGQKYAHLPLAYLALPCLTISAATMGRGARSFICGKCGKVRPKVIRTNAPRHERCISKEGRQAHRVNGT